MNPAFLGLSIARSGLQTQQANLDIIGQNIANASVDGYTRRRLHLKAAPALNGMHNGYPGDIGTGVQADLIQRIRDELLDKEYRNNKDQMEFSETQADWMQRVEAFFGELGDFSIGKQMDQFFNAWQELSLRPDDLGLRRVTAEAANDIALSFRTFVTDVKEVQKDIDSELQVTVDRVNELSSLVASLNKQISDSVNLGNVPGDLMDQRDRHFDELSALIGGKVVTHKNGSADFLVNGKLMIGGEGFNSLRTNTRFDFVTATNTVNTAVPAVAPATVISTLNPGDLVINGVDIGAAPVTATPLTISSPGLLAAEINARSSSTGVGAEIDNTGRLKLFSQAEGTGFIDLKVSSNGATIAGMPSGTFTVTNDVEFELSANICANKASLHDVGGRIGALKDLKTNLIPAHLNKVNNLAVTIMERVNNIHESAYDLEDNPGRPFFTGSNAGDIEVAGSVLANPALIAIAADDTFPPGDGSRALDIAQLRFNAKIDGRDLDDYYNGIVSDLGVKINQLMNQAESRGLINEHLQNQRDSVSGVNLDEELTSMLEAQRAFSAAARLMTTMDEMLNLVINGLGA